MVQASFEEINVITDSWQKLYYMFYYNTHNAWLQK